MTGPEIEKATVLDILFENRNKMYGAYPLRKYYNQRLLTALVLSSSLLLLLLLLLKPTNKKEDLARLIPDEMIVKVVNIPPAVPEPELPKPAAPQPPAAPPAPVAQQQFTQIHITNDPVDAMVPAQTDLNNAAISNTTVAGAPGDVVVPVAGNNTGNGESNVATKPDDDFHAVEQSPEFPGGAAAWAGFLNRYLQSPDALEPGEKKTVVVRFLVGKDGSVTQFEIVRSAGRSFDNEVIRVLQKMPKWIPAVQNGHAVTTTFMQPVTFVGIEE